LGEVTLLTFLRNRLLRTTLKSFGVTLIDMCSKIDEEYPTETPSQKTARFIETQFSWLDFHFKNIMELRGKFDTVQVISHRMVISLF
jgi:hypothetical protein